MRHLNKKEWISATIALVVVGYMLFSGSLMSLFSPNTDNMANDSSIEQATFVADDVIVGDGPLAEVGREVTVHYTGSLLSGEVFDSSVERGSPFSFTLGQGQVIRGWDEGLVGMRVGGKRMLVIGAEYGYGASGYGPIPPNATLLFEVELLDVK